MASGQAFGLTLVKASFLQLADEFVGVKGDGCHASKSNIVKTKRQASPNSINCTVARMAHCNTLVNAANTPTEAKMAVIVQRWDSATALISSVFTSAISLRTVPTHPSVASCAACKL